MGGGLATVLVVFAAMLVCSVVLEALAADHCKERSESCSVAAPSKSWRDAGWDSRRSAGMGALALDGAQFVLRQANTGHFVDFYCCCVHEAAKKHARCHPPVA